MCERLSLKITVNSSHGTEVVPVSRGYVQKDDNAAARSQTEVRGEGPTTESGNSVPVRCGQGADSMCFLEITGLRASGTLAATYHTLCYRRLVLEKHSEMERLRPSDRAD